MLNATKPGDTKEDFCAWLGMLGPPTIWLTNFEIIYARVLPACAIKSNIWLIVSSLVCLALIVGCGFLALRECGTNEGTRSRRFMAHLGLMSASLFTLVTIAQVIAMLIMEPCST
jgi:CDP-diglyceride synthetase